MLGLDSASAYNVCDTSVVTRSRVSSVADWAHSVNKRVGLVTTARVTHATPGAVYSHTANRDWESDSVSPEGCGDIAAQLVQALQEGTLATVFNQTLKY